MHPSACADQVLPAIMRRDAATWFAYLLLAFFTFLLNIQGNILPFLQLELGLGYGVAALHSSAIALGMILTGLAGERMIGWIGRGRALALGGLGAAAGAVLLCLAPAAWASIAACFILGIAGSLVPAVVPAMLAQIHGPNRDRALTELAAACYAFAVMAPLTMSTTLWLGLGWRGALLAGVAAGLAILLIGRAAQLPESPPKDQGSGRLPLSYWVCWLMLAIVVAVEFSILLWAPAYLQQVVGLSPAIAAGSAAVFAVAMLAGRIGGSALVGRLATRVIFVSALLVTLMGFALYWQTAAPLITVFGLAVVGLGTALLYPLSLGMALEAAGPRLAAQASARVMLAVGLAVLAAPVALGAIADRLGLATAHLVIPGLTVAALLVLLAERKLALRQPVRN